MGAIDIGPGATDLGSTVTLTAYTRVSMDNPANDTGKITSFEIYARDAISGCKIGTFYGSGTTWTCRDYETIGSVSSGSKQTFSGLDCDVSSGDYIGEYDTDAGIAYAYIGGSSGLYYKSGDGMVNNYTDYTNASAETLRIALYGTGTTDVGWTGKINGVANPAKIWGIAVANIAKVGGIA